MTEGEVHELVERITEKLYVTGAKVMVFWEDKYSYTIVSRVDKIGVMAFKVAQDLSKIPRSQLIDLAVMYKAFGVKPLIVTETRNNERLKNGVMYEHIGLPLMNVETLNRVLTGEPIRLKSEGGVIKVKVKGELLKERRLRYGLSLGDLAELLSVSRKAVYEYERGSIGMSAEKAQILIELFGEDIVDEWAITVRDPENRVKERLVNIDRLGQIKVREMYLLTHSHGKYAVVSDNEKFLMGEEENREAEELSDVLGVKYVTVDSVKRP